VAAATGFTVERRLEDGRRLPSKPTRRSSPDLPEPVGPPDQDVEERAQEMQDQWNARADHTSWCARQIRQAMISRLNVAMSAGFPIMQVLVPMAPLLGLIGTVTGMLEVFDSMALRGNADARSMASGVSQAMLCTMSGLAVSITGLYPVHYFRTRTARETELLADRFSL